MRRRLEVGAAVVLFLLLAAVAMGSAQSRTAGVATHTALVAVVPSGRPAERPGDRPDAAGNADRDRIRDLDQQIARLHEQFRAQADPLQTQLKSLREKLEADLKPLEDERHDLIERGKSPALRDLDADEASQLAALADHEKGDIEKVRQDYAQQRATLKAAFDQKRRDLHAGSNH